MAKAYFGMPIEVVSMRRMVKWYALATGTRGGPLCKVETRSVLPCAEGTWAYGEPEVPRHPEYGNHRARTTASNTVTDA